MDDAIPEEMKTVKQRRKSQLRNEVHYDSAGDDPELPEPIVLESDSQFAVTETQLADMPYAQGRNNFDGDIDEVGDLDPETAAVLAKFAVAKRDVPKETSNVEFKLLTRHPDSQGPTVQDSAFAFTAAKPGMAKQPGTTSTGSSQPTRGSFEAAMVTGNMPSQGSQGNRCPAY